MTGKPNAARPPLPASAGSGAARGGLWSALSVLLARFMTSVWAWLTKPRHLHNRVVELEAKLDSLTGRVKAITGEIPILGRDGLEVLDQMGNAYIAADASGAITLMNGSAAAIFQTDLSEIVGINLFDFLSERCRTSSRDLPKVFTNGSRARNLRVELIGLKGSITPCLLTVDQVEVGENGRHRNGFVVAITDNTEVEMLTFVDPLTGLYNRRYFDKKLTEDYAALERGKMGKLSLVFLDVDLFGKFNKDYGAPVGDQVLRQVGDALKRTFRCNDTAARYGGEEFVAILAATDEQGAHVLAERIRRVISGLKLDVPGHGSVRITASVGTATHRYESPSTADQLVAEADEAMRLAKQSGRNQTKDYTAVRASHHGIVG